jgi:hypothetical protein
VALVFVLVGIAAVIPVIPRRGAPGEPVAASGTLEFETPRDGPPIENRIAIKSVPTSIRIKTESTKGVRAELPKEGNTDYVLQLYPVDALGRRQNLLKDWDDPPVMDYDLPAGVFELEATTYELQQKGIAGAEAGLGAGEVYSAVMHRVKGLGSAGGVSIPVPAGHELLLTLGLPKTERKDQLADKKDKLVDAQNKLSRQDTPEGVLEAGARVLVQKPDNVSEGPGWVESMDEWEPNAMTVRTIASEADGIYFSVLENEYLWDARWVRSILAPGVPPPTP